MHKVLNPDPQGMYAQCLTSIIHATYHSKTMLKLCTKCHVEEGEGDFYFDEDEVLGGLDDEAKAALLARQAAGMDLEEAEGELGEVSR